MNATIILAMLPALDRAELVGRKLVPQHRKARATGECLHQKLDLLFRELWLAIEYAGNVAARLRQLLM